jgi:tRNA nucleotidyltransferase/poly(A) polymerase
LENLRSDEKILKMPPIENILSKWIAPVKDDMPPLYLVGGAVRDHLLSRKIKDIDLACDNPENVAAILAKHHSAVTVPLGIGKGTICHRVVNRGKPDDFVDVVELRNGSIEQDLQLRDFTINAIAIQITKQGKLGRVIDPMDGMHDLKNNSIRITGPDVFKSDPLRTLRAIRFAAELRFTIEEFTISSIRENSLLLSKISAERILVELLKIFQTNPTASSVRVMDELGILEVIFPEIRKMKNCIQNGFHHLDVWNHSLAVLQTCETITANLNFFFPESSQHIEGNLRGANRLPLIKMAALLHDVGKPVTKMENKESREITFHDHDREGGKITSAIAERLKMPIRDREFLRTMVAEHMHVFYLSRPGVKEKTILKWFKKLNDDIIPLIIIEMADSMNTRGPASLNSEREAHIDWSKKMIREYYNEIRTKLNRKNIISGNDLISLGIKPGPELGQMLEKLREAQDTGLIVNHRDGFAMAEKLVKERRFKTDSESPK